MRSWKIVKAPFVSCLFDLVNYLTPTLRLSFHATRVNKSQELVLFVLFRDPCWISTLFLAYALLCVVSVRVYNACFV